jgi:hypothetical protein
VSEGTLGRRQLLAALLATSACGGSRPLPASPPPPEPLVLDPAADLLPAPGLVWLLDARLRELFVTPAIAAALALVLPPTRLDAFAKHHGGVDLRSVGELALASYGDSTLSVARVVLDPKRVESAFASRALAVEGRAEEGSVVRTWGSVGGSRQQLAILGREAIVLEQGAFGHLRAAELFARGKLKRAFPALLVEPLARVAQLLGDAPLRAFAPGPFEGELSKGLGGLLAGATAVGGAALPREHDPDGALALRFVVTGAWGSDAGEAAKRLKAAFDVLGNDPLGRLMGVDRPLEGPVAYGEAEALRLEVTVDALGVATGLRDATGATIEEVMK